MTATTTALLMQTGIVGSGLIIGWLWMRTESIWIVALAHGALNDWGQYAFKYMRDIGVRDQIIVLEAGSLALLVAGSLLVALGLPATTDKRVESELNRTSVAPTKS
jgi:hypothetical protein